MSQVGLRSAPKNPSTADHTAVVVISGSGGRRTSRPLLGATWDPFIANSPVGATLDLLVVGATAANLNLPFGTLLCDPIVILTSPPGVPFSLPIPKAVTLIGTKLCTQGGSVTAANLSMAVPRKLSPP